MSADKVNAIAEASFGNLEDRDCRHLMFYMIGYLRDGADGDVKRTQESFFSQIQFALERRGIEIKWIK